MRVSDLELPVQFFNCINAVQDFSTERYRRDRNGGIVGGLFADVRIGGSRGDNRGDCCKCSQQQYKLSGWRYNHGSRYRVFREKTTAAIV